MLPGDPMWSNDVSDFAETVFDATGSATFSNESGTETSRVADQGTSPRRDRALSIF